MKCLSDQGPDQVLSWFYALLYVHFRNDDPIVELGTKFALFSGDSELNIDVPHPLQASPPPINGSWNYNL